MWTSQVYGHHDKKKHFSIYGVYFWTLFTFTLKRLNMG